MKKIILLSCVSIFIIQAMDTTNDTAAARILTEIPQYAAKEFIRRRAEQRELQKRKAQKIQLPIQKHRRTKRS